MAKAKILSLMTILIITLFACTKPKGIWEDNIHLSTKSAEFNASGDSVTIKTGGDWWWISDVSVDSTWYYGFTSVDMQSDNYTIKEDCFTVERRDKNTLFIKVAANPNNVKRIITVGLEAGDYFDRVTITQKPK
ncbi:BACON domain-containing protein [Prolixibacter denitrificans]|uniref:BACON domain-containing protein n=1 Tax=Prolixibacter denitrificans TaxID=1541063 RepID=A0A2P8C660_9BACT|nr:BACON domain-containing protein [Prolixibacter denitrificans]PSK80450.1 hypothetical protein CLV93_11629 [Prolixibacter denitrificans]GET23010.1 hypothetical protein JCM18694_32560 [Prolixibacter denitrificans]